MPVASNTVSSIRWDAYPSDRFSDVWSTPELEDRDFRAAERLGLIERFSRNGWRTFVRSTGGSGTVDRVRLRAGVEVCVMNCVLPALDRRSYNTDESGILLFASLSCDLIFRVEGRPPIAMNRPELTLVSVPKGMPLTIDVQGGVRQQRILGLFRNAQLAKAFGLDSDAMPQVLRDAAQGTGSFGRLLSLPLDHHVASLVADTIDTPLQGEMRAMQYEGRLTELVAYAIEALQNSSPQRHSGVRTDREADLALRARQRLSRDFRRPPDLDDLARELGTNPNKLRSAFKAAFGVTMSTYCLDRRMREAQQLLLQARLSIAQVAERVGYQHPSAFTAIFTSYVGTTPREYRQHRSPINVALKTIGKA